MTTVFKSPTVAEYLAEKAAACGKTPQGGAGEIALEMGHPNSNVGSPISYGKAKLSLKEVKRLERLLGVDQADLLRVVLRD